MNILRALLGLMLTAWLGLAGAQDLAPVPPLKTHVTDLAGMLNADQRAKLEKVLQEYETRSGGQIGILLVPSTAPEAIEQYSIRVAEAWKLGRKGVDDGVILVVAKDNPKALRRLRIEAGRGIQGTVTDAQSKRILEDVIAPHFRQNDFYGGLTAGIGALTSLMDQEHLPAPAAKPTVGQQDESGVFGVIPFFVVFIIIAIIAWRMRNIRPGLDRNGWGRSSGVMLGSGIGSSIGSHGGFGGSSDSGGGGGFSGGGGGFDGGGASGDW